jgi:hypothetical protein
MRVLTGIITLVCAVTIGAVVISAEAQRGRGAQVPQNLQVLPSDMTMQQVTQMMQSVRQALGVQCNHCHIGGPADRAKDDLPTKTVARNMFRMVMMLNQNLGATMEEPKITCYTCHRGSITPATAPEGGGLVPVAAGN